MAVLTTTSAAAPGPSNTVKTWRIALCASAFLLLNSYSSNCVSLCAHPIAVSVRKYASYHSDIFWAVPTAAVAASCAKSVQLIRSSRVSTGTFSAATIKLEPTTSDWASVSFRSIGGVSVTSVPRTRAGALGSFTASTNARLVELLNTGIGASKIDWTIDVVTERAPGESHSCAILTTIA